MSASTWQAVRIQRLAQELAGRDLAGEKLRDSEQVERIYEQLDDFWMFGDGPRCAYPDCDQPANPDADDLCGWHFKDRHRDPAWDAQRLAAPDTYRDEDA